MIESRAFNSCLVIGLMPLNGNNFSYLAGTYSDGEYINTPKSYPLIFSCFFDKVLPFFFNIGCVLEQGHCVLLKT